jgi:hypothetical protein
MPWALSFSISGMSLLLMESAIGFPYRSVAEMLYSSFFKKFWLFPDVTYRLQIGFE